MNRSGPTLMPVMTPPAGSGTVAIVDVEPSGKSVRICPLNSEKNTWPSSSVVIDSGSSLRFGSKLTNWVTVGGLFACADAPKPKTKATPMAHESDEALTTNFSMISPVPDYFPVRWSCHQTPDPNPRPATDCLRTRPYSAPSVKRRSRDPHWVISHTGFSVTTSDQCGFSLCGFSLVSPAA